MAPLKKLLNFWEENNQEFSRKVKSTWMNFKILISMISSKGLTMLQKSTTPSPKILKKISSGIWNLYQKWTTILEIKLAAYKEISWMVLPLRKPMMGTNKYKNFRWRNIKSFYQTLTTLLMNLYHLMEGFPQLGSLRFQMFRLNSKFRITTTNFNQFLSVRECQELSNEKTRSLNVNTTFRSG